MSNILISLLMLISMLFMVPAATEQNSDSAGASAENPLLELLALIPDSPEFAEAPPGFVDYEALRSVYPEIATFDTWSEWNAAGQQDEDEAFDTWMRQMLRLFTGPNNFLQYLALAETTRSLIGFDFFDVDRAMLVGFPPSTLTIYQGSLEPESVTAAYQARDYQATEQGDVTLLSTGEDGMKQNIAGRDPANPFGGDLGRNEPLALLGDTVIGTPNDALLNTAIDTVNGEHPSLAEQGPLAAIAEALYAQEATPLQVQYLNVDVAAGAQPPEAGGALPSYSGAAIADMQLEEIQIAAVALAFEDEADAQAAADELAGRFITMTIPNNPSLLMLEEVEGANVLESQVVHSESTGLYVAVGMIAYPLNITDDPQGRDGTLAHWWNTAYQRQEFNLLAVTT